MEHYYTANLARYNVVQVRGHFTFQLEESTHTNHSCGYTTTKRRGNSSIGREE